MKTKWTMMIAALMMTACVSAQKTIQLPEPDKNVKMTLMEALQNRQSSRSFYDEEISDATLSQVLWAACGINRPAEKKITAPSAINAQDIKVYVCRKDGAWRYEPNGNMLVQVCADDLRKAVAGRQEFAAKAPLSLVLVSDHDKLGNRSNGGERMGLADAGYVSENICLVCTALGLKTVPRMTMDEETLRTALQLGDYDDLVLNHPIGK